MRARSHAQHPMAKKKDSLTPRAQEILDMFASIPVELLHQRALELLNATRHISQGRDREVIEEPDNAVRLKVWQTIIEQQAGAAASRRPVEPTVATGEEERPKPGELKPKA